jgi:hypothetical protein
MTPHPVHTAVTDRAKVEAAARALAANFMVPKAGPEAVTAAVRMFDRMQCQMDHLQLQVDNLKRAALLDANGADC